MKTSGGKTRRSILAPLVLAGTYGAQQSRPLRVVRGIVTDPKGTPLNGVSVRLKNLQSLQIRSYITQEDGAYRFTNVAVGAEYEISAHLKGRRSDVKAIRWYEDGKDLEMSLVIDPSGPARD